MGGCADGAHILLTWAAGDSIVLATVLLASLVRLNFHHAPPHQMLADSLPPHVNRTSPLSPIVNSMPLRQIKRTSLYVGVDNLLIFLAAYWLIGFCYLVFVLLSFLL